jgi:hypothetical protein
MELIPIEDLERWPVKVIAFFVSIRHGFPAKPLPSFLFHKMLPSNVFGMCFVDF